MFKPSELWWRDLDTKAELVLGPSTAGTAFDPGTVSSRLSLATLLGSLFPFSAHVSPASSESVLLSNRARTRTTSMAKKQRSTKNTPVERKSARVAARKAAGAGAVLAERFDAAAPADKPAPPPEEAFEQVGTETSRPLSLCFIPIG